VRRRKTVVISAIVGIALLSYFTMPLAVPATSIVSLTLTPMEGVQTYRLALRNLSPWPVLIRPLAWMTKPSGVRLVYSHVGDVVALGLVGGPILLGREMRLYPFHTLSCPVTFTASYSLSKVAIALVTMEVIVLFKPTYNVTLEASS